MPPGDAEWRCGSATSHTFGVLARAWGRPPRTKWVDVNVRRSTEKLSFPSPCSGRGTQTTRTAENAYSGRRLFRLEGGQGQAQVVAQTAGRSLLLCRNNDSYAAAPSQPCSFVRSYSSVFFLSKTVLGITRLKTRLKSLCLQCKFYCRQTPVRVKTCFSVSWGVAQMFRPCQSLLRWISPRSVHLKGTS